MAFMDKTRRKLVRLQTQVLGAINPLVWDIPKTGLLAGIFLDIHGTIVDAIGGGENPLGLSSIVRRVRLIANSGIDLINISGPGYHYLLRNFQESYHNANPNSNGTLDVIAGVVLGTYDLGMFLPCSINRRDPMGLFMLQNEATLLQLSVEAAPAATVSTNAVITMTVTPTVEIFTVPLDQKDWPPLNVVHQMVEDTRAIPAGGQFVYPWPRGNTYLQVLHGCGLHDVLAPADNWTRAILRVNQSESLWDVDPIAEDLEYGLSHGAARYPGVLPIDMFGSSGLGTFGSSRDFFYSPLVTEVQTEITAVAAGPLITLRRQLVALKG